MITIDSKISKVFEEMELSYTLTDNELEVSANSPEGQDCNATFTADYMENLLRSMAEWIDDFDADQEAYLWVGADGHGKNGAPYHIKDIVEDMEWWHKQIDTLHDKLTAIDQEREYTCEWCQHCGIEAEFVAELGVQKCPSCGKYIVVCSMCDTCKPHCTFEEVAHELNEKKENKKES